MKMRSKHMRKPIKKLISLGAIVTIGAMGLAKLATTFSKEGLNSSRDKSENPYGRTQKYRKYRVYRRSLSRA
jgi:hypothetical protein